MWVLGYLVIPGQAVKAQSTASGISTLQIQTVQVKTGQHPSRVVHNPCRIHQGRLFRFFGDQVAPAQYQVYNINESLISIHFSVGVTAGTQETLRDLTGFNKEYEVGYCPLVSADVKYTQHRHTSHLPASQIYTIQSETVAAFSKTQC